MVESRRKNQEHNATQLRYSTGTKSANVQLRNLIQAPFGDYYNMTATQALGLFNRERVIAAPDELFGTRRWKCHTPSMRVLHYRSYKASLRCRNRGCSQEFHKGSNPDACYSDNFDAWLFQATHPPFSARLGCAFVCEYSIVGASGATHKNECCVCDCLLACLH